MNNEPDLFNFVQSYRTDSDSLEGSSWVVLAFKLEEQGNINYYLIPLSTAMNRPMDEMRDFETSVRFPSLDEMISYIKQKNRYGISVEDGLFYTSENTFYHRIPHAFDSQERHRLKSNVDDWQG